MAELTFWLSQSFAICSMANFGAREQFGDLCMQVMKVVFPVYYGAQYQCVKMPRHAVIKALKAQQNEKFKALQPIKATGDKPGPTPEAAAAVRKADLMQMQPQPSERGVLSSSQIGS